jgi:hypothetical protein
MLVHGMSFVFRVASDSDSFEGIVDVCSSFRTNLKVTMLFDCIFMGRKRFLLRISCLIIIMAATFTIALSFGILK